MVRVCVCVGGGWRGRVLGEGVRVHRYPQGTQPFTNKKKAYRDKTGRSAGGHLKMIDGGACPLILASWSQTIYISCLPGTYTQLVIASTRSTLQIRNQTGSLYMSYKDKHFGRLFKARKQRDIFFYLLKSCSP